MERFSLYLFFILWLMSGPAFAAMEDYPSVTLQGLDKSVGRTTTFEAKVGSTIQYGPLFIKINACRKAPPIEKPESAAFLQIWEVPPGEEKSEWAFSGWMFASSPALSAMDHPVYDVWVLDCVGKEPPKEEVKDVSSDAKGMEEAPLAVSEDAVPTDSEAEEGDGEGNVSAPSKPVEEQQPVPSLSTGDNPVPDEGVTAYDFMKKAKTD